jgi:hypothetical protein
VPPARRAFAAEQRFAHLAFFEPARDEATLAGIQRRVDAYCREAAA